MLSLTIAYPYSKDKHFNMDYYLSQHLPKLTNAPGAKVHALYVEQGLSGAAPDTPPAYFCIAHVHFQSLTDLMDTLGAAAGISTDFPNYTDVTPIMHVAEVKRTLTR